VEPEPHLTQLLVTGASGALGRRTTELLLEICPPGELTLVTRTPDALGDLAERGVEVRFGDFAEPESLPAAFAGGKRMLLISAPDIEARAGQHAMAIRAAQAAGVRHIVYTSALNPEPLNPAVIATSHYATECALAASDLAWTVLRNSLYAEYQVAEAVKALAAGTLEHNRGTGRIAYVSREDCAAAAAAVLLTAGHEEQVYDVTGPDLYSADELAVLYGELGGRNVEAVSLGDDEFVDRLQGGGGADEHARYGARVVASLGRSVREGYMAVCSDTVATLTRRPARTLRSVVEAALG
jgi:NAD(P)H dehydrogenase (quinone)